MVAREESAEDAQALILERIDHKRKKGSQYASGMTLVVFINADTGEWFPNRVARALPNPLYFNAVWVISLQKVEDGEYTYGVTCLDVSESNAPVFLVRVSKTSMHGT